MENRIYKIIFLLIFIIGVPLITFIPGFMDWLLGGVFTGKPLALLYLFLGGPIYIGIIIAFIKNLK